MNVYHLATYLQGGAGRVIVDLAVSQRRAGDDVTVVISKTQTPGYATYRSYLDTLGQWDIAVHEIDSLFVRDHMANLRVARFLARGTSLGDGGDTIIHAHAATPALIGLLASAACRRPAPVVETMHGWGISKTLAQASTDVDVMALVDRVVVPSRQAVDLVGEFGVAADRIVRVPYGVGETAAPLSARDLQLVSWIEDRRRAGWLVAACVGTIGSRKNQELLVDAIARSGDRTAAAVFIGDGDAEPLCQAIDRAGLGDRAIVHGYSPAARELAASAGVLVLPSKSEGQPLAVLEAFADGVLVVTSDIPELVELVDDGRTGFTCVAGDAASLAAAIDRVRALSPRDFSDIVGRARARQAREYTLDVMHQRYRAVYHAAARERRAAAAA